MTWKDKLVPASFRNEAFFVPSIEQSGGRRSVIHVFPGREVGYTEDMGKTPRKFSVEGYVIGKDYFSARDKLLNALEAPGPGKLVHPYFGEIEVQAGAYTLREMQDEGGMARFTMSFDDAGSVAYPSAAEDTTAEVGDKRGKSLAGSKSAFEKIYDIAAAPYAVTQSALRAADKVFETVGKARRIIGAVAAFERDLDNIRGKGIQGILTAQGLAGDIEHVLTYGTSREDAVAGGQTQAYAQFKELTNFSDTIENEAPAPISQDDLSLAIIELSKQIALAAAAGMLAAVSFSNTAEARETAGALLTRIDTLLETTTSDEVFATLSDLRKSVVADMNKRALALPDLVPFTAPGPINSLALSWQLYGNLDGEADIIARNKISNPAFISGGKRLEVLADAG